MGVWRLSYGYVDVTLRTITPYGEVLYGYGNGSLVNTTDWLYSSPLFVTRSELVKIGGQATRLPNPSRWAKLACW